VLSLRKILLDQLRLLLLVGRALEESLAVDRAALLGLLLLHLVGDHGLASERLLNFVRWAILGGGVSAAVDTECARLLLEFIIRLVSETVLPVVHPLSNFVLRRRTRVLVVGPLGGRAQQVCLQLGGAGPPLVQTRGLGRIQSVLEILFLRLRVTMC